MTPDHDLLIQIDTKLSILNDTVNAYGPRFEALDMRKADVSDLVEVKANLKEANAKISLLQKFQWMILGGLAIAEFVSHIIFKI